MQEITPLLLLGFLLAANSLWIIGFWLLFEDGFLLGKVAEWIRGKKCPPKMEYAFKTRTQTEPLDTLLASAPKEVKMCVEVPAKLPESIRKPLYQCPFCMSSVHGSAWYLIADLGPWYYLPVYCVALCGAIVVLMWGRVE